MKRRTFLVATASASVLAAIRSKLSLAKGNDMTEPLLAPWTGNHGGVPPFDKIKPGDWRPAIDKGMEANRADIAKITAMTPDWSTLSGR